MMHLKKSNKQLLRLFTVVKVFLLYSQLSLVQIKVKYCSALQLATVKKKIKKKIRLVHLNEPPLFQMLSLSSFSDVKSIQQM